jgi:electron transfer flavoprotein alpha subunit
MSGRVLVLAEHSDGKIASASWDAIVFGQKLAQQQNFVTRVVFLGEKVDSLAAQVSTRSGLESLIVSDQRCGSYLPEIYCDLLLQVIRHESPVLVLMGHTYQTIDFAPRLAMMLDSAFVPNCIDLRVKGGRMLFERSVYGGKLNIQVTPAGRPPYLFSVQAGRFSDQEFPGVGDPKVIRMDIRVSDNVVTKRKVLEVFKDVQKRIDLGNAKVIVAGGRGVGNKENFGIIVDLAKVLGASVGASRPVTDGGWVSKEHQIGSSGQSVAPRLYIACGISGAPQHLVGIRNAGCIVAINKDPYAPILGVSDYAIVGDLLRIVPELTQAAKEMPWPFLRGE